MKINGKMVPLAQKQTLAEFLLLAQYDCRTVAVEHNGRIVPRDEYQHIWLSVDDTLEVVRFVGGG